METPAPKRKRFYRRKRFITPLIVVIAFLGMVGPWPIYTSSYEGQDYSRRTFERADGLAMETACGPLKAGFAQSDITPPVGEPLAGYGGRKPMTSEAVNGKLYAKAMSFSAGGRTVTIVSADILLVMPELREEVLRLTKLPARDVYFAATHTHSGPGGYSTRWVDQLVLGKYSQDAFSRLAKGFSDAILDSRSDLTPATISEDVIESGGDAPVAVNRIDPKAPALQTIYRMSIQKDGGVPCQLYVCPAHATCYGSSNRAADGDYPGLLQQSFKSPVMVLAGAVGSMGPPTDKPRGPERAQDTIRRIVLNLSKAETAPPRASVTLSAEVFPVDLPPLQYRISQSWRLSPVAARYLHDRQSYIHVLRINDFVFLGMPADYSGELAMRLAERAKAVAAGSASQSSQPSGSLVPVVTSFNGDYVGYLLPQERYWTSNMESVDENLCGPWGGEYFNEISLRLLKGCARGRGAASIPASSGDALDTSPR